VNGDDDDADDQINDQPRFAHHASHGPSPCEDHGECCDNDLWPLRMGRCKHRKGNDIPSSS